MKNLTIRVAEKFKGYEGSYPDRMGIIYLFTQAFLFSLNHLFNKLSGLKSQQLTYYRAICMFVLNDQVCRIFRIPIYQSDSYTFQRLVMRGVVGCLSLASMVYTVKHCSLSECIPIIYCSPIWTGIAGALIFKESFGWLEIMTSLFGISGMCFIFKP